MTDLTGVHIVFITLNQICMKIRTGKEFVKFRFEKTQEYNDELTRKRDLHRLFNPKIHPAHYIRLLGPKEEDLGWNLKELRRFKHNNIVEGIKTVNDPKFRFKVKNRIPHICPRLLGRAPHVNKIRQYMTVYEENYWRMIELGWRRKMPSDRRAWKRQRVREQLKWHGEAPPRNLDRYDYSYDPIEHKFTKIKKVA